MGSNVRFASLIASSLMLAGPAIAQASAPVPVTAVQAPPRAATPMVCEWEAAPGSRIPSHRVCHTAAQWADLRRQGRDAVQKAQSAPCLGVVSPMTGTLSC